MDILIRVLGIIENLPETKKVTYGDLAKIIKIAYEQESQEQERIDESLKDQY